MKAAGGTLLTKFAISLSSGHQGSRAEVSRPVVFFGAESSLTQSRADVSTQLRFRADFEISLTRDSIRLLPLNEMANEPYQLAICYCFTNHDLVR
jgi:hypothetical protein